MPCNEEEYETIQPIDLEGFSELKRPLEEVKKYLNRDSEEEYQLKVLLLENLCSFALEIPEDNLKGQEYINNVMTILIENQVALGKSPEFLKKSLFEIRGAIAKKRSESTERINYEKGLVSTKLARFVSTHIFLNNRIDYAIAEGKKSRESSDAFKRVLSLEEHPEYRRFVHLVTEDFKNGTTIILSNGEHEVPLLSPKEKEQLSKESPKVCEKVKNFPVEEAREILLELCAMAESYDEIFKENPFQGVKSLTAIVRKHCEKGGEGVVLKYVLRSLRTAIISRYSL